MLCVLGHAEVAVTRINIGCIYSCSSARFSSSMLWLFRNASMYQCRTKLGGSCPHAVLSTSRTCRYFHHSYGSAGIWKNYMFGSDVQQKVLQEWLMVGLLSRRKRKCHQSDVILVKHGLTNSCNFRFS